MNVPVGTHNMPNTSWSSASAGPPRQPGMMIPGGPMGPQGPNYGGPIRGAGGIMRGMDGAPQHPVRSNIRMGNSPNIMYHQPDSFNNGPIRPGGASGQFRPGFSMGGGGGQFGPMGGGFGGPGGGAGGPAIPPPNVDVTGMSAAYNSRMVPAGGPGGPMGPSSAGMMDNNGSYGGGGGAGPMAPSDPYPNMQSVVGPGMGSPAHGQLGPGAGGGGGDGYVPQPHNSPRMIPGSRIVQPGFHSPLTGAGGPASQGPNSVSQPGSLIPRRYVDQQGVRIFFNCTTLEKFSY